MKTGVQRKQNLQIRFLYLLASFPGIQRGKEKAAVCSLGCLSFGDVAATFAWGRKKVFLETILSRSGHKHRASLLYVFSLLPSGPHGQQPYFHYQFGWKSAENIVISFFLSIFFLLLKKLPTKAKEFWNGELNWLRLTVFSIPPTPRGDINDVTY